MGPRGLVLLACVIGILFQLAFFREDLGLNAPLLAGATLLAGTLARPRGARLHRADRWLIPAALFFAACLALRTEGVSLPLGAVTRSSQPRRRGAR